MNLHDESEKILNPKDKVGKHIWEKAWNITNIDQYTGIENYLALNNKLDKLLKKFLPTGNKKIFEIGCARGKKLIYFSKEFDYEIFGIDYSESGVEIALRNLKMANIKGTILCEDAFQTSFQKGSFDVVYSMGLIEHFENPESIIDVHIDLLKTGGILIITIPNFNNSLYMDLSKIICKEKEIIKTHNLNVMKIEVLAKLIKNRELDIKFQNYFGPIDLMLVPFDINFKPLLYLIHSINQIIGYATFFIPLPRYFSPYLVVIAEKRCE